MGNRHTDAPRYPRGAPKVVITMTTEEKARLTAAAKAMECTVSELVRGILRAAGLLPKA